MFVVVFYDWMIENDDDDKRKGLCSMLFFFSSIKKNKIKRLEYVFFYVTHLILRAIQNLKAMNGRK